MTAHLAFLNPGSIPVFVERIGMGLRGARGVTHKAWIGKESAIAPGDTKSFSLGATWPRSDLATRTESIIAISFTVGTRGGELLLSGLGVPDAGAIRSDDGPGPYGPVRLVAFPGKPAPARYRSFSFTYPTSAWGRAWYWLLRSLGRTPSKRFNRWCKGKPKNHKP